MRFYNVYWKHTDGTQFSLHTSICREKASSFLQELITNLKKDGFTIVKEDEYYKVMDTGTKYWIE